jgi:hypothetical protein
MTQLNDVTNLIGFATGEQRPSHAHVFIGQGDGGDFRAAPSC